jgi:dethiobiotin synthetase
MSDVPRGLFVTGTDTGVGKTRVSCMLLRAARSRGLDVGAMKPIETGVGEAGPLDALALRAAAEVDDALDSICPQQYALPAAPCVAAAAEGRKVELATVFEQHAILAQRHAALLVEGAGGLRVPTTRDADMGDLAAALALPVLVVARAALGTINHTELTLADLDRRGLPVVGVVVSHADGRISDADEANLAHLRDRLGERLVGELPYCEDEEAADPEALDLNRILAVFE